LHTLVAHTPVLLGVEGSSGVGLPHVVEGGEPDDVGRDGRLHGGESSLLVLNAGNSLAVGATLSGPASLGDPDIILATAGAGDLLHRAEEPVTTVLSGDITVEEGVSVDGNVVRDTAQLISVSNHGNSSVDSDDLARVTSGAESSSGSRDDTCDKLGSNNSVVDNLVTNRDGVDSGPVVLGLVDEIRDLLGVFGTLNVEETSEDLQVVLLARGENKRDLVAVGTVETDEVVAVTVGRSVGHDLCEIAVDLVLRLAVTAVGVRRVDNTVALRTTAVGGSRRRGGSLGGRGGGAGSRAVGSGRRVGRGLSGGVLGGSSSLVVDRGKGGGGGGDVDLSRGRGGLSVGGGGRSNNGSGSGSCGGLTLSGGGVRSAVLVDVDDNVGELGGHVGVVGLVDDFLALLVKLLVTA